MPCPHSLYQSRCESYRRRRGRTVCDNPVRLREDVLLDILFSELSWRLEDEAFVGILTDAAWASLEAAGKRAGRRSPKALAARIDGLDRKIARAARRLVELPEAAVEAVREEMARLTRDRQRMDRTLTAILRATQRAVAAEHSRRLSVHIVGCQSTLASRGYWMGGRIPVGLQRALVSRDGKIIRKLEPGEEKVTASGLRVILVPGNPDQVDLIGASWRQRSDWRNRCHLQDYMSGFGAPLRRPVKRSAAPSRRRTKSHIRS